MEIYAKENGFKSFEISVKDKDKIDEMFNDIVRLLIEDKNGENNCINNINNNEIIINHNSKDDINHNSINNINHNSNNNNLILSSKHNINEKQGKATKKKKKGHC